VQLPWGVSPCLCVERVNNNNNERRTYESVSSTFSSLSVGDDDGLLDLSVDGEVLPEGLVGGVVGQPADEELGPRGILVLNPVAAVDCGVVGQDAEAPEAEGVGLVGGGESCARHQHVFRTLIFGGIRSSGAFFCVAGNVVIFGGAARTSSKRVDDVVYVFFGEGAPAISHRYAGPAVLHIKFRKTRFHTTFTEHVWGNRLARRTKFSFAVSQLC
jgi:hypothetical protein